MILQLPIDYNAIRASVVAAVKLSTGLTCIVEEPNVQGAPRPALPYFSMKITTPGAKNGDDALYNIPNGSGQGTDNWGRGGNRKMSVSFSCYALIPEDAYSYMALWQASLELEAVQSLLSKATIAVWLIGNVADLSKLLNTGYEGRSQMDVQFGVSSNITQRLDEIDTATVTGNVPGQVGPFTGP